MTATEIHRERVRTTGHASPPLRVCVCTSIRTDRDPRAPRHAAALAATGRCQIRFIDALPRGESRVAVAALDGIPELEWTTFRTPHSRQGVARLLANRLLGRTAAAVFRSTGHVSNTALNSGLTGYESLLKREPADLYIAHNIDTLWPAWKAARRHRAQLIFDSMEYHADMGSGQSQTERQLVDRIQRQCLPDCLLVLSSSPEVGAALERDYGIDEVLSLYNVPPTTHQLAPKLDGFNLYWRNSVVNTGERGLGDVLLAMRDLSEAVRLHVQGGLPFDGGERLRGEIAELGLTNRVTFHPPYRPDDAVREASRFQVGLCLERHTNRNHEWTVSNKLFDYHMGGLAVVSSDLPGLKNVVTRSGGGLCYRAGDVDDLRAVIRRLHDDPSLFAECAQKARAFALSAGNVEHEMTQFLEVLSQRLAARAPQLAERLCG
jgi:glycosyltransferase involved in cell wall biosynthesis